MSFEDQGNILKNVFACKKVPLKLGATQTHDFHEAAFVELFAVVEKDKKLESFLFYLG